MMRESGSIIAFIQKSRQAALSPGNSTDGIDNRKSQPQSNSIAPFSASDQSVEIRLARLEATVSTILEMLRYVNGKQEININNAQESRVNNQYTVNAFQHELTRVHELIQQSNNEDAMQQFESFKKELTASQPKPGTLRGLWAVITEAVPAVKDALEIGRVLVGL